MSIGGIACVAVVAAFLAVLLRAYRPEFALALGLIVGIILLCAVLGDLKQTVGTVQTLLNAAALPEAYGKIVFKSVGACLIAQLAADACRDAGERAMAEKVELAGKIVLVGLSLPLFQEILRLITSLIGGEAVGG